MNKPVDIFYIEFGGDPSKDGECYKRYSSKNEHIKAIGLGDEVFELVEKKYYDKAVAALKQIESGKVYCDGIRYKNSQERARAAILDLGEKPDGE